MNMELSRRHFLKGAGAGLAGTTLGAFGFGDIEIRLRGGDPALQARQPDRDAQHLSLLLGRLRRHHVLQGRPEEGREGRRSSISRATATIRPTAARSARRAPACWTSCIRDAPEVSDDPQARLRQVRAGVLGRRARPHRAPDEGRSRQELHREEQGRRDGQPLDRPRASSRHRATTNETAWVTYKVVRSMGMVVFDNQARV